MLTSAAEDFATAAVPRVVFKAFQQALVTTLRDHFGSRPFLSNVVLLSRTTRIGCAFALCKTSHHATPRLDDDGGPRWLAPAHQRTAPEVGEVASQDTASPSEAGTSSSSAWCAGKQGTNSLCETCNGPSTACQSGHSPSRSTRESKEASCGRAPCRVEGSKCRGGASIARPDRAVRIIYFKIAATVDRARQSTSDRGRTLDRSQGPVGEVAIGGSALSRSIFCDTADSELTRLRSQVVDLQRAAQERVSGAGPSKMPRTDRRHGWACPDMPSLMAELDDWMKARQGDLQEALEFQETERVLELTSKLSRCCRQDDGNVGQDGAMTGREDQQHHVQGSTTVATRSCSWFVVVDGRSLFRVLWSRIRWGSVQHPEIHKQDGRVRRTFASVGKSQDIVRFVSSRYGLRGVRVGEASHTGPRREGPKWTCHQKTSLLCVGTVGDRSSPELIGPPYSFEDNLQGDFMTQPTEPATSGALRAAGVMGNTSPTPAGGIKANRFF